MELIFILFLLLVNISHAATNEIECRVRTAAIKAASKLLPGCRLGRSDECDQQRMAVYKGIKLQSRCSLPYPSTSYLGNENVTTLPTVATTTLYVSSASGSDSGSNNGLSESKPFATLKKALDVISTVSGKKQIILLPDGPHYVHSTLWLNSSHSNLIIRGKLSASRPSVRGTVLLDPIENVWENHQNGILKCTLSPSVLAQLGTLSELLINGEYITRARHPNVNPSNPFEFKTIPLSKSKFTLGPLRIATTKIERVIIPTDGLTTGYTYPAAPKYNRFTLGYLPPGTKDTFDPPVSFYFDPSSTQQGCGKKGDYSLPTSIKLSKSNLYPPITTNVSSTGLVHLQQTYGWGEWTFFTKAITSSLITFGPGGWQEARGDCQKGGGKYIYLENIMELLDSPNEYFLDLKNGILYYYPRNDDANPLTTAYYLTMEMTLPKVRELIKVVGATNVNIQHVEFVGSYSIVMDRFEVPSGGDSSVHRSGGVHFEDTTDSLVEDCVFHYLSGNGLTISQSSKNVKVRLNEFFAIGGNALLLLGDPGFYTEDPWVIKKYPENVTIEGNTIHEVGIRVQQSSGVLLSLCKGITVSDNVLYLGPRAGITIDDQFGGGHLLRKNVLFEFVLYSLDHGPIMLWNRQQYEQPPKPTDIFELNFILGTNYGNFQAQKGIDVDDGAFNILTRSNVIVWGFHKLKGSLIKVYDSLIINPVEACAFFSFFSRSPAQVEFKGNTCISSVPPYAYGIPKSGFTGMCDKVNFDASNNKFYNTRSNQPNIGGCASTWKNWLAKYGQDVNTLITKAIPTPAVQEELIYQTLPWIL